VKLRHVEHLTARISSFSFQIFVALFLYAMGCQFRVNRQQNKRKTAWMRRHVRFAPLPLFPFRSLLELIKPALAGCLITTPPFCLSHWYRNQAIVSLSASRIEARRSPLWPSGLPSSGWEGGYTKTRTDSDTRDRDRDAMFMLCYPRFFPFSPRFHSHWC
jgi:hypothetical protein